MTHMRSRTNMARLLALALRLTGKDYEPDPELPAGLVAHVLVTRAAWLARGFVRFRRFVFVGPRVRLRGRRSIVLGRAATLERGVVIDGYARRGVSIGPRSKVGAFTAISCTSHLSLLGEGFSMGADSGIGDYGSIGAAGGVWIGSNVIMGQFVSFHSQEHDFSDVETVIRRQATTQRGITIGDNCWVGARVTFLDETHVGEGSVVAAGAVVKGVFPPFSVVGGVPARVIRSRIVAENGN